MELIITPSEVVRIAFAPSEFVREEAITESAILAAQQKFILPALNGLYDALLAGRYPELKTGYVAPVLALYVKLLVLPALAAQAGTTGITEPRSDCFDPVSDNRLRFLLRRVRNEARALMRPLVEKIESEPERYPDYDPNKNILHQTLSAGEIVL